MEQVVTTVAGHSFAIYVTPLPCWNSSALHPYLCSDLLPTFLGSLLQNYQVISCCKENKSEKTMQYMNAFPHPQIAWLRQAHFLINAILHKVILHECITFQ